MEYLSSLSEESMQYIIDHIVTHKVLQVLDMVDRRLTIIDWSQWSRAFACVEALGFIKESEETHFNLFVHSYTFTGLGARLWKFYVTQEMGKKRPWWHNLPLLKK